MPLSHRSLSDVDFIPSSLESLASLIECRDLRTKVISQLFNIIEEASQIQLSDPADLDTWHDSIAKVFESLDHCCATILPLEGQGFSFSP